ncbi:hypothetical protein ACIRVK_31965 [Streptomyces sp. NPDC101152]|uniref:WXG100 family type VII secretion target n=1 Tax=Streptomyces sp. NPDC101152 TaxID=3366116 RepID=UPI00382D8DB3
MADSSTNGSGGGGSTDYQDWTWKQIKKAVTGKDPDQPADDASASQLSNPQSLQDAADTFWYVEQVLQQVAQNLDGQTQALSGPNGPWQGEAAQAFNAAMTSLSKQVTDMANTLSGGITGDNNVPQQLANNAQHLREAISKLDDIDVWYANQALKIDPSLKMSNGRVEVHKLPQVVNMMTNDMRQVLTTLAGHYKVTQDSVAQPNMPKNPTNGNPSSYDPSYTGPNSYNGYPPPNYNVNDPYSNDNSKYNSPNYNPSDPYSSNNSKYQAPNYQSGAPTPYGGGGTPSYNDPSLNANGPNAGGGIPSYNSNSPNDVGGPQQSGAKTDPNVQPYNAPTDPSGAGSLGSTPGNSPLDQNAAQYPGDTSTGQSGAGTGTLNPAMDAALNPGSSNGATDNAAAVAPYPNVGSTADSPAGSTADPKLSQKKASPYSGGLNLDSPGLGDSGQNSPANADVAAYPGGSMPKVDTSGTSAPGSLSGSPDTGLGSNSPALSNSALETGAPAPSVSGYPGGSALGGDSMPYMPMGGMGSGGAGGGGSQGSPSGASGLLGGDAAPWRGSPSLSAAPGDVTGGAGQGGPGLSLPQDQLAANGVSPSQASPAESGMPMMPMGGMGAGAGNGEREHQRSDASGLLSGTSEPWSAAAVGGSAEIGSPQGAPHEEGHLQLPDAYGLSGDLSPEGSAQAALSGSQSSAFSAEEFAAGILEGMSFAAAAGAAGAGTGEGTGGNGNHAPQAATSAWGEPEWGVPDWGTAEYLLPAGPAEGGQQPARGARKAAEDPTLEERAVPQAEEVAGTSPESAERRGESGTHGHHQAPQPAWQEPVHEAPAGDPAAEAAVPEGAGADDVTTWDSAPGLFLPLFGVHRPGADGDQGASTEADRQGAAAVTTVAAGAFATAHAIGGNRVPDEPVRPAWRPKASGSALVELTCALDEPEEESGAQQPESEDAAVAAAKGNGKGNGKGREDEEEEVQSSFADLLRQSEDAWGGGVFG